MVMPSRASSTMTSSTSLIISGSSAEVGSSNSIAIGSIDSARAIATRCCWPPESWPGYLSLCAIRPTRSRSLRPLSRASACVRPSTLIWPRVRFSVTLMCGNSSKFWNTMPMRARSLGRLVLGSPTEMPSTVIFPSWNGSSPLTHLISVDLPEPDGPQTTTTSPLLTSVEQFFSTCTVPYHLLTLLIVIMARSPDDGDAALQVTHGARGEKRDQEIDERGEQVHFDETAIPLRHFGCRPKKVGDRQNVDERSVLEQDNGLRQQ